LALKGLENMTILLSLFVAVLDRSPTYPRKWGYNWGYFRDQGVTL
jgi:hypothetical protein